jgi:hypothetical protein
VAVEQAVESCRRERRFSLPCRDGRQHAAGRAEAAHQRIGVAKLPLDWMQRGRLSERFDGSDAAPLHIDGEKRARVVAAAVNDHGACTAHTAVTDPLGPDEIQPLAHGIEQRQSRLNRERMHAAVDRERHRRFARTDHRRRLGDEPWRLEERGRNRPGTNGLQKIAPCVSGHAPGEYTRRLRRP